MLRSVYGMSCSSNHAFAFRHDVQLGEVNNVTIIGTLPFKCVNKFEYIVTTFNLELI
jgi:hypothetical protein